MSLEFALLGFLNYQSMTGYELKQFMDVSTSNFWHAKQSQIYTTLKKMEEKGFVTSEVEVQDGRPDRRIYTIMPAGQNALQAWLEQAVTDLQPKKELLLLKLFFSSSVDKQTLLAQLHLQRGLHQQQAALYKTETKAIIEQFAAIVGNSQDALLWDATRHYGELFEEMTVRWLDETIALIEQTE
ncbi:MAG: PadR family transcriptional regulator [Ardenticatenaceae bacterium]|nr:PadR family transcriptional regulator [Anaerolineales bacterium]MCB8922403.1 PadR family transcriptional regulator [Ardenticatenaceae bacterium]MCB8991335.1 PadR family transcriptional regulator [Ardenticatenaceae bacterium]